MWPPLYKIHSELRISQYWSILLLNPDFIVSPNSDRIIICSINHKQYYHCCQVMTGLGDMTMNLSHCIRNLTHILASIWWFPLLEFCYLQLQLAFWQMFHVTIPKLIYVMWSLSTSLVNDFFLLICTQRVLSIDRRLLD